jgi:hypothetical protein
LGFYGGGFKRFGKAVEAGLGDVIGHARGSLPSK